jgi:hypothetical protein
MTILTDREEAIFKINFADETKMELEVIMSEFIETKSPKAKGKRFSTLEIASIEDITPEPEELKESNIPTFRTAWDVAGFLSGHTFRDDNGHRLVIKPNSVYLNGRALTGAVNVEDFSIDEATLKAHSPFSNTTYQIWLVRTGNTYQIKMMSLPSYKSVEVFYMID